MLAWIPAVSPSLEIKWETCSLTLTLPPVLPQATLVSKSKGALCLDPALVTHFLLEAPDLHVATLS